MHWGGCADGLSPRGARLAAVISTEEQLRSLLHPGAQGELINNLSTEKIIQIETDLSHSSVS